MYVIGIDGGGSKTVAELFDESGKVLADARGEASNFQIVDADQAAKIILELVKDCCKKAQVPQKDVAMVAAGLAGAGRDADQILIKKSLKIHSRKKNLCKSFLVESDARIALEGAFGGKPGIIVIAGTGSIVYGKDSFEKIHRAGGWGRLIGDEGSGYFIGRQAFRMISQMIDGYRKKGLLYKYIAKEFNLASQSEIIQALYKDNFDLASAAPIVLKAAEKGDQSACEILSNAAEELTEVIMAAHKKMLNSGWNKNLPIPLAFVGGLLSNDNIYSKLLKRRIKNEIPKINIQDPEGSPVKGAALLAWKKVKA